MSLPVLAVCCAVLAGLLMWKRSTWRRTQAVLMLVVGLALGGLLGEGRAVLTEFASDASVSTTAKLFGVGVPYAVALFVVVWFALDMDLDGLVNKLRKKKGGSNKHTTTAVTPWLALLVPPLLAILPVVGELPSFARDTVSEISASMEASR